MDNIEVLSIEQNARELVSKLELIKNTSELKQKEYDVFVEKSNEILNLMTKANYINNDLKLEIGKTFNDGFFDDFKNVVNQKNQLAELMNKIDIIFKESNTKQEGNQEIFEKGISYLNSVVKDAQIQNAEKINDLKLGLETSLAINKDLKKTTDTTLALNNELRNGLDKTLALNKELISANILLLEKLDAQIEKSISLEKYTKKILDWIECEGSLILDNSRTGLFGKKK